MKNHTFTSLLCLGWMLGGFDSIAVSQDAFRFPEARSGKAELHYVGNVPVLSVVGTPDEIGRQKAALTKLAVKQLIDYPEKLFQRIGRPELLSKIIKLGHSLEPQIPKHHLDEMDAFAQASGIERNRVLAVNTMVDTYRGGFGCSSLLVDPSRSATDGPLFGRNLDFYVMDILDKYSLVVVHHPEGKRPFALVTFPGMFGCVSGMNDAGLALAVHEVFFTKDDSPIFTPEGIPYTLLFRRILEECATTEEAESLLRASKRTTLLNLAACDRQGAAVFEITPNNVVVRRPTEGICACTNHFRTRPLAVFHWANRYNRLMASRELPKIGIDQIATKLHEVNMGQMTVQTMIFEPKPLILHLAIGSCPTSARPLTQIELAALLKPR